MIRKHLLLYPALLTILLIGCRRTADLPETMEAHYMVYQIEYLEEQAGDIPTRILPGTMEAYYTKHYVYTRIDGFLNQFSLVQIADLKHKRVTTLLSFFGSKVYYRGESGELPAGVAKPDHLKCKATGETAVIGGVSSEQLAVEADHERYNIYSTKEFSIRRPNISTPFHMVDDPLTDFRIELSRLKIHLTCMEMESKTIESEIFTIPGDYKAVNRNAMEEIINSLFTKD
ncbi:MAG: hypothetical protein ABFS10_14510 [Bacteroidota bacterium]